MSKQGFNIEVTGVEELRGKLNDPQLVKGPLRDVVFHATGIGKKAAKGYIDGGTGVAVVSIRSKVRGMSGEVYSLIKAPRAKSIEEGRKPGETVPLMALVRWMTGRVRSFSPTAEEWSAAARAQAAIKKGGAKGKRFIEQGHAKVTGEMPRLLREMADKVRARWGK